MYTYTHAKGLSSRNYRRVQEYVASKEETQLDTIPLPLPHKRAILKEMNCPWSWVFFRVVFASYPPLLPATGSVALCCYIWKKPRLRLMVKSASAGLSSGPDRSFWKPLSCCVWKTDVSAAENIDLPCRGEAVSFTCPHWATDSLSAELNLHFHYIPSTWVLYVGDIQ